MTASAEKTSNDQGEVYTYGFDADGRTVSADEQPVWSWHGYAAIKGQQSGHLADTDLPEPVRQCLLKANDRIFIDHQDGWTFGALPDMRHRHRPGSGRPGRMRFAFNDRLLITARRKPLKAVQDVRTAIEDGTFACPEPTDVIEAVVERMIAHLMHDISVLSLALDKVEEQILGRDWRAQREKLVPLRRQSVTIHRHIHALSMLYRGHHDSSHLQADQPEHELLSRFSQAVLELDHDSDQLLGRARLLQEEIMARLGEQSNRLLFALSVLTASVMPATIISGLLGMNVGGLPGMHSHLGFWIAVGMSFAGSALIIYLIHRFSRD